VATALSGADPLIMLAGPGPASRKVLAATGLTVHDIDEFEVNEAFASVVLAWMKELAPNPERVNANGGAVPAYGVVRATGLSIVEPGRVLLAVLAFCFAARWARATNP